MKLPTSNDILISFTTRRLQALLSVIEKMQELGEVPVDDRDALDGVKRQIQIRLTKAKHGKNGW